MSVASRQSADHDDGPQLLRDIWGLTATAIVIVILRIIAKLRIGKFGPDDLLMGFALCLATVGSAMMTIGIHYGFGQNVDNLSDERVSKVIMFDYLTQTFGLAGGALGRMSFIVFIIGLLVSRQWHRLVFWILIGFQLIINSMFIIILFVQCQGHASAIWEHSDKAKCWSTLVQAYYGYFQGAFNSATDLYLAVFSTVIFWKLNLKLKVKLGLVSLLGLGIFAMVAAIIKTVQTRVLASYDMDPTKATVSYDRWLFIETYLVIITASIPCIRSLLRSIKGQPSTSRNTHELNSRYVVSSSTHTGRRKQRDSSIDAKRMIDVSEGHVSNDDCHSDGHDHDDTHDSGSSREYVIICV
ncbi:hypothetical protein N7493_006114 [Penicillium malachiteum]|uniref:Rhodopsin domain-containing protein n=1 Tax=Penicillium malachiteum TaxID=1324776 RepID=A0AAD6HK12_9EURO|nr:hypothetical protein N7493_006114 [Penicillium malachiteum]